MFLSIKIDNFEGISLPIDINFISESRNRDKLNTVVKTHDGIYVNRLAGFIGGNSSGKTTIINVIGYIGNIISGPVLNFDVREKVKEINKLVDSNDENKEVNNEMIRSLFDSVSKSVDLECQNMSRTQDDTKIEIEMYIVSEENEHLTGYYKYLINFSGNTKKINKEYFSFRKNYKQKENVIFDIEDLNMSHIYYINKYFKNMIDLEDINKKQLEDKYAYCSEFRKHYINSSGIINTSDKDYKKFKYVEWYKKSPDFFESLVKIVDPKIVKVILEEDNDYERLSFVLEGGYKLNRVQLSTGTKRFLKLVRYVMKIISNNGILIIDEIEQNIHMKLVWFIMKLFSEIENKNAQIIFTTHCPEIFDMYDKDDNKIFKQDAIYVIYNPNGNMQLKKLKDVKIDDERVKIDALVANLYRKRKIANHPNEKEISDFVCKFKETLKK